MGQGHLSVSHHMEQKPVEQHGSSGWLPPPPQPQRLLHLPSYNSPYFVARGLRILTGKSRDGPAHPVPVVCLTNYTTHRKT